MVDEARRTSFDRRAAQYDAVRPSYPRALVDDVIARSDPQRMLEIGAGTGKATVLFARTDRALVALEPGPELAATLRRNVAGFANVTVEDTTFEAYAGDGFDLVYAAQAFHWVDPAARYGKAAQVLRPGGTLAVITNEKAPLDPTLQRELDAAYARLVPGETRAADPIARARHDWTAEIEASGRFAPPHVALVPWTARYSAGGYLDLLDTYSDHIVLPDSQRRSLYALIADAIERHGGHIEVPYVAMAFIARLA